MSGFSDSLKILNQKSVSMADLSKVYKNVKGKIDGVTWQSVRAKASRPLLKELLKAKVVKTNEQRALMPDRYTRSSFCVISRTVQLGTRASNLSVPTRTFECLTNLKIKKNLTK